MSWTEVFVGFDDELLDRQYESEWLSASIPQLRIAVLLAGVFGVGFLALDRIYFQGDTLIELATFRIGVMLPICVGCYVITFIKNLVRWVFPICGVSIVGFTAYFCSLAIRMDESFMSYLFPVIVQLALFLFVLLRIPFRLSLITGVASLAVCAFTFSQVDAELYHRASFIAGTVSIFVFLLFNLFQRELKERKLFINQRLLAEAEHIKHKLQHEREEWFRNFAGFLRHELNNQLVGMRGSLDLLERLPERREQYLTRANASLERMRLMVNEAADATSIEAALDSGTNELCDLSELVSECIASYAETHTDFTFEGDIDPAIAMMCQPFRMVQLLDKLIDNAARHSAAGGVVHVRLHQTGQMIRLEVENEGDPLPEDKESLFDLWHTGSASRGNTGRQGLGLYVVARIAAAHGGVVRALDLEGRIGACMQIDFPRETAK